MSEILCILTHDYFTMTQPMDLSANEQTFAETSLDFVIVISAIVPPPGTVQMSDAMTELYEKSKVRRMNQAKEFEKNNFGVRRIYLNATTPMHILRLQQEDKKNKKKHLTYVPAMVPMMRDCTSQPVCSSVYDSHCRAMFLSGILSGGGDMIMARHLTEDEDLSYCDLSCDQLRELSKSVTVQKTWEHHCMIVEDDSVFNITPAEYQEYIRLATQKFDYQIVKLSTSLVFNERLADKYKKSTGSDYKIRPVGDVSRDDAIVWDCSLNFGTFAYVVANPIAVAERIYVMRFEAATNLKKALETGGLHDIDTLFYGAIDDQFVRAEMKQCTYRSQIVTEVGTYSTISAGNMDYTKALAYGTSHCDRL